MKRIIVLAVVIVLALSYCYGQQNESQRPVRTQEEIALKQTERLQKDLQLTQEQCDTLYQIHLKYIKMRKETDTRQQIEERMTRMRGEIMILLTPEQQEKLIQSLNVAGPSKSCGIPRISTMKTSGRGNR